MIAIPTVIAARGLCAFLTNMLCAPAEIAELRSGYDGDFDIFSPGFVVHTESGGRKLVRLGDVKQKICCTIVNACTRIVIEAEADKVTELLEVSLESGYSYGGGCEVLNASCDTLSTSCSLRKFGNHCRNAFKG
jgi:hypothetical protein